MTNRPRALGGVCGFLGLVAVWTPAPVLAHEVRPGYLELVERAPGRFDVVWKQPVRGNRRLPLEPLLPGECKPLGRRARTTTGGVLVERWSVDCREGGLVGRTVAVAGLDRTFVDILVRLQFADGSMRSHLLRARSPDMVVARHQAPEDAAIGAYLRLGVEHLVFGFDHILFIVGLMFLVTRRGATRGEAVLLSSWSDLLPALGALAKVITAFTLAHSVTLALSTLELVRLSQAPVEGTIALSILFLAVELTLNPRASARVSWTRRFPWAIALGFGLLHGFGFAGALADIGVPRGAAAQALLLFNLGVELGQLLVVALILVGLALVRAWRVQIPPRIGQIPIYVMGTLSAYWLVKRVAGML